MILMHAPCSQIMIALRDRKRRSRERRARAISITPSSLHGITVDMKPYLTFQVLTKDSVTVSVDAVVYYRVSNATVSVANVENAHHSTRLLAQTTLRNILGTKNLHEILSDRESISGSMQTVLDEATAGWGIKVERVEM